MYTRADHDDHDDHDGPAGRSGPPGGHDLRHHGDAEVRDAAPGLIDLAVNVRAGTPPGWLRERIAGSVGSLAAYPDGRAGGGGRAPRPPRCRAPGRGRGGAGGGVGGGGRP
ncbi:hypothetical protein ABZX29_37690, partial [Streptomyces zhihengii]